MFADSWSLKTFSFISFTTTPMESRAVLFADVDSFVFYLKEACRAVADLSLT